MEGNYNKSSSLIKSKIHLSTGINCITYLVIEGKLMMEETGTYLKCNAKIHFHTTKINNVKQFHDKQTLV